MSRPSKFTDEQKCQIALELLAGKISHAEIYRKYDISSTYAYKIKDRALWISFAKASAARRASLTRRLAPCKNAWPTSNNSPATRRWRLGI